MYNTPMSRKSIRESIKKEVSYRQSYKCAKCSLLLPPSFQIDHIIPWSVSNDDSEDNLQALCPNCHSCKTQKETMRIIHYKRFLEKCPEGFHLCWFCLETYLKKESHDCGKVLKNVNEIVKSQTEILSNFEEMCNRYKYVKKIVTESPKDSSLKIKIQLFSNTIYVNNVIVKYTEELFIEHIVEAVFLATRKKADSGRYTSVIITIETASNTEDDDKNRTQCLEFLESNNLVEKLPERIFKKEDITVIFI